MSGPSLGRNQPKGVKGYAIVRRPAISATEEMWRRPISVREGSAPHARASSVLACLTILAVEDVEIDVDGLFEGQGKFVAQLDSCCSLPVRR